MNYERKIADNFSPTLVLLLTFPIAFSYEVYIPCFFFALYLNAGAEIVTNTTFDSFSAEQQQHKKESCQEQQTIESNEEFL